MEVLRADIYRESLPVQLDWDGLYIPAERRAALEQHHVTFAVEQKSERNTRHTSAHNSNSTCWGGGRVLNGKNSGRGESSKNVAATPDGLFRGVHLSGMISHFRREKVFLGRDQDSFARVTLGQ